MQEKRLFIDVSFSPFFRVQWMYKYQGMIVLATNQVWWTWEVEDVFNKVIKLGDKMAMKKYAKKMHQQINDLVVQVLIVLLFHFITACKRKITFSFVPVTPRS